ncbi:MAG: DNA adenine methylase [Pseudomonadota bacterium]|nr:DNA adenine methylase [Pseudomonadota bacterium]
MATRKPSSSPDPQARPHVTRSVLRYFGGKWQIAPWVISHLPAHRVYVEPFGGAASVLLRKPRSRIEVYNDLDEEIVGLFRLLQDPVQCARLIRLLRRTPYARAEFERAFAPTADPLERARRAIVRAYMAFHHEALFNLGKTTFADARHRSGNHCKAHEWASYPRHLVRVCQRLQGVVIERRDALEVLRAQDSPDTLFFVDPPYLPSTRSQSGYRHELDHGQHVALLERLLTIRGRAVVAGYPSQLYDQMLQGWQRVERPHRAAGSRRPRTEVLWIKPPCQIVPTPARKRLAVGARRASITSSQPLEQGEQP